MRCVLPCSVPKLINHDKRRRQIIQAAWKLIAADGIGALTLRRVAAEAKIVPGSVRYIYETQDALVNAVADELVAQTRNAVEAGATRYTGTDAAALRLFDLVPVRPDAILRWKVEHAIYVGASQHPRFADDVAACRNVRGAECLAVVRSLANGLQVPGPEIDLEVLRALALIEGLSHLAAHGGASGIKADEAQVIVRHHVQELQGSWRRRQAGVAAGSRSR